MSLSPSSVQKSEEHFWIVQSASIHTQRFLSKERFLRQWMSQWFYWCMPWIELKRFLAIFTSNRWVVISQSASCKQMTKFCWRVDKISSQMEVNTLLVVKNIRKTVYWKKYFYKQNNFIGKTQTTRSDPRYFDVDRTLWRAQCFTVSKLSICKCNIAQNNTFGFAISKENVSYLESIIQFNLRAYYCTVGKGSD